ncbi:hypothetical protein LOTGIDRAFT_139154 [Lottia gigantea]|uniref:Reelin domain-containing protein n=1 Tax=Lottia gigantea TaxID=225164 RepID=V4B6P4_LOTGI|nr:hypothetical protein LOTGIDRAFT_139154 [Lottia gigantea]ESP01762.1 hypothetical protein LOTGIDRAFT_139154 [Lottia gigantea]
MYLSVFVLSLCLKLSSSYPSGAPPTVCGTMMPGHNVAPQGLPQIINIFELSSQTYSPNSPITVKVKGTMAGLLLQARKNSDMLQVGSFSSLPKGTKVLTCQGTPNSVTHSNKTPNTDPTFTWNPPASDVGDVTFYLTMVKDYSTFWVKIPSPILTYSGELNHVGSRRWGLRGGGGSISIRKLTVHKL